MGIGFPTNHWLSYDWPLCLYPSVVPTGPAPWTRRWSPCPAKQRGRWPSSQWGTPQTRPTLTGSLSATWTYPPVTCLVSRAWESHQGTVSRMLHRDQLQKILLYPNVTVSVDFNDADSSWHSKLNHAVAFSILTKSHHLNYIPLTYLLFVIEWIIVFDRTSVSTGRYDRPVSPASNYTDRMSMMSSGTVSSQHGPSVSQAKSRFIQHSEITGLLWQWFRLFDSMKPFKLTFYINR